MSDVTNSPVRFKLGHYFMPGSHKVYVPKGEGLGAKVAISLPRLVSETNSFSTKNRPGCAPSLLKSNPKELFLDYNVKCNLETSDPAGHDVKIHFDLSQVVDDTTAKDLDVAVTCSCPAFLYWGAQWNTYQRDALEGDARPLLTAPTERLDLRDGFVICKHVKAVSERILPSVQHNIVKILRQRKVDEAKKVEEKKFKLRPTLEDRQREMRERQLKKRKAPAKDKLDVRKQLEKGLALRNKPKEDVIQRDTPATPGEKQRVPVIPPAPVVPAFAPIPDLDDDTPAPPPAAPLTPQKMPVMQQQDRQNMQSLVQQEQKRMQKEDQRRRDRETQQRLRNGKS